MKIKTGILLSIFILPILNGCLYDKPLIDKKPPTASQRLAANGWLTVDAQDQNGQKVELTDDRAKNYVGYAYFKKNGTFKMYNLNDSPKMQGTWSVSEDGKTRTINAMDDSGKILFTRVVDIITLNVGTFTYRVKAQDGSYVDIVHRKTEHTQPK